VRDVQVQPVVAIAVSEFRGSYCVPAAWLCVAMLVEESTVELVARLLPFPPRCLWFLVRRGVEACEPVPAPISTGLARGFALRPSRS
jgi:hypothetical protein